MTNTFSPASTNNNNEQWWKIFHSKELLCGHEIVHSKFEHYLLLKSQNNIIIWFSSSEWSVIQLIVLVCWFGVRLKFKPLSLRPLCYEAALGWYACVILSPIIFLSSFEIIKINFHEKKFMSSRTWHLAPIKYSNDWR